MRWIHGALGLGLLSGVTLAGGGCSDFMELYAKSKNRRLAEGGSEMPAECVPRGVGGAGSGGAGGAGGAGGSATGAAVGDECGVFVSSSLGDDRNAGTKDAPLKTMKAAMVAAALRDTWRVYACGEDFQGPVVVPAGITLFGGLDCANGWPWIGDTQRTVLRAEAGEIPLKMTALPTGLAGAEGAVRLEDVDVIAASVDPGDPMQRGMSSIAALAVDVAVELARCTLEAGDGMPGVQGEPYVDTAASGAVGNPGLMACSANQVSGGAEELNDCGTPDDTSDDSVGGGGGPGQVASGGAGSPGLPEGMPNGGTGQAAALCTAGTAGQSGAAGTSGAGGDTLGTFSITRATADAPEPDAAYLGPTGAAGGRGVPGQGGGGGGGAKGGTGIGKCTDDGSVGGASGGSGGSGGCGGLGGSGGGPGGAAIALLADGATFRFEEVRLRTGSGGAGGPGIPGQIGGSGGDGGLGGSKASFANLNPGCRGGRGGDGGDGGPGGGGRGGHALGLAVIGAAPTALEGVTFALGTPGPGGGAANPGADGVQAEVQAFPPP